MSRRMKLSVEGLEARDMMSIIPYLATSGASAAPHIDLATQAEIVAAQQSASGSPTQGAPRPPVIPGTGQPTAAELRREHFHAYFNGPFYVGPGRFTDQAKIFYLRGLGGSTQFRHGDYQMGIVLPVDTRVPIVAVAYLQDRNINSSGILGLDMTADPTSLDSHGRPTRFTFVSDFNIYSGTDFFNFSSGTVKVGYHGGAATVVFDGRVYTSGLTNPLENQDLQSRGGRLVPRGN